MMLGIDAGNTNISFGIFNKKLELANRFELKTNKNATAFEFLAQIEVILKYFGVKPSDFTKVRIASVVPEVERALNELFVEIYKIKTEFINASQLGLKVNLHNPSEVGIDRLINVFSAFKLYNTKNVVIIDFGTAITFDVGINGKEYDGGIIYPGINLSLEALKNGTSKLPKVSLKEPSSPVGKSTSEAINAGIFYGYSAMVNGVIKSLQKQYKCEFTTILTGGFAGVLKEYFDFSFKIDNELILKGISIL